MVENLGADSDDDESKKPTVSVVIDEDEPHIEPIPENDQSEITSTTVEEIPTPVLEDHNYTGAGSSGRSAAAWRNEYSEGGEQFPVLEGLGSYVDDSDTEMDQQQQQYNRSYGPSPPQRRIRADQSGRVTSSMPAVIHSGGGYPVRTGIRHKDGSYGQISAQPRQLGGPTPLPAVFNQRGAARTIRQSEYGIPMRSSPASITYGRYGTGSPAHPRAIISSSTSSAASNGSYQSMLASDPSRIANDNAPAPLIIPSRGVKPPQRSRMGIPQRMPMGATGYTQSPRKFYQVTKTAPGDYALSDNMHSYAKAPPSAVIDYDAYGTAGGSQYPQRDAAVKAGEGRTAPREGDRRSDADQSATFIDVVAEEEAQNAKFFQRQTDAISGMIPKQRTSSFNEQQEGQRSTPIKHIGKEQILVVDSPQHQPHNAPLNSPPRFRSVDGNGPGVPQRHRLMSTQIPNEYGRVEMNHNYSYTISPDTQDIFATKQAQRPRGRPRGSRTSSVGSQSAALMRNRQMHKQQMYQLEMGVPGSHYLSPSTGIPPTHMPSSTMGNEPVGSSSGEVDVNASAEFHARPGELAAAGQRPTDHEQITSSQDQQQAMPSQVSSGHQQYMYQQQGEHHRPQQQMRHVQHLEPEIGGVVPPGYSAEAATQPAEFSHADAQILQHQQRLERQQQQMQASSQQHLGGQQYQSLEDLAELAQLSQQHFISSAQRPIYADSASSMYLSRVGGAASPTKRHLQQQQQPYPVDSIVVEPSEQQQPHQPYSEQQPQHPFSGHHLPQQPHHSVISANANRPPQRAQISQSDSQLLSYFGHTVEGHGYPSALNQHQPMPNFPPYNSAAGDQAFPESEQFQPGVYPTGHQMHSMNHENLVMEKMKKPRKPRTPKDPEALAEKRREKKERKQKMEGEKTPRRPRKQKNADGSLIPTQFSPSQPISGDETQVQQGFSGIDAMASQRHIETPQFEKQAKKRVQVKKTLSASETDDVDSPTDDEDYGDYTTRCLCGMTHNDDFMIQCDKCDVWQHGVCMDVSAKNPPKTYFCELCEPRMLKHTKQHAASIQKRVLAKIEDSKRQAKSKNNVKGNVKGKLKFKPKRGRGASEKPSPKKAGPSRDSVKPENQYSRSVRAFVQQTSNLGDPNLLKSVKGRNALARQMFVANNVEGLVALLTDPDSTIAAGSSIIEYNGMFQMASETTAQSKLPSAKNTSSLRYCGFGEENAMIIDASKFGSAARFARRSCKPNAVVRHVIYEGRLHLLLVSSEVIGFSQEITIPFDFDFTNSRVPVSCACGSTDEQFGRENPTDCEVFKFNQALALAEASLPAQEEQTKSSPRASSNTRARTQSASHSPAKVKKPKVQKEEESKPANSETPSAGRRRSARIADAPESNTASPAPETRKTRALLKSEEPAKEPATIAEPRKPQDSVTVAADEKPEKKADKSPEPRKTRSSTTQNTETKKDMEAKPEPRKARSIATQKIEESSKDSDDSPKPRKVAQPSDSHKEETSKDSESTPEPRKTRSVVKQETQTPKASESTSELRKTRSTAKQETETPQKNQPKSKIAKTLSPKQPESSKDSDQPKLSREDRKVQEAMAVFQRMEERQKHQQEKRKSTSSTSVTEKRFKTEPRSVPEHLKRSSLRLMSTSSASSSTSSVANTRSGRRVIVVDPKVEEGTPLTPKGTKRISLPEKEGSPSKKKRLDGKQISHVEAAQLLTEMAFGMKSESAEDLTKDLHSRLLHVAELAVQNIPPKSKKEFSLASNLIVASRDDKIAAKKARAALEEKAEKSTSARSVTTVTQSPKATEEAAKVEPKEKPSQVKERSVPEKETKVKSNNKPKEKEEASAPSTVSSPPTVERSPKRRISESQKQKAANENLEESPTRVIVSTSVTETAAADSSVTVATAPATSSTADSTESETTSKVPLASPPSAPATPVVAAVAAVSNIVVLPSTIVTKSVKKLTLAEYKKRQSSSVLTSPNADTRQLRSSPSKPQRGFMPSLKDVSASSSSLSTSLLEPNLSPRSAILSAIPAMTVANRTTESGLKSPPTEAASSTATSQVDTPSLDELRHRIYGGKSGPARELMETPESAQRTLPSPSTSQPRMTLEERLKNQFGLGRQATTQQPLRSPSSANPSDVTPTRYGHNSATQSNLSTPRTMMTRARASPYDTYNETVLVPPPPPPPSFPIPDSGAGAGNVGGHGNAVRRLHHP